MSTWDQITAAAAHEFADVGDAAAATRIVLRLLIAAALGAVLGFDRESKGKSAGLRTHMLVALGSAIFIIVPQETGADSSAMSRVIQGLLAGIGFLGAGTIVKGRPGEEIEGITTAATIWVTASLGMSVGLGHILTAIIAAAFALVVLRVLPGGGPNGHNAAKFPTKTFSTEHPDPPPSADP